jgi:hypothetical protein
MIDSGRHCGNSGAIGLYRENRGCRGTVGLARREVRSYAFFLQSCAGNIPCDGWFFVLFAASMAKGAVNVFGRILAVWIFLIALFPLVAGACVTWSGQCPMQQMMEEMQKRPTPQ